MAGAELTFGVSGALIMNALVMYDLETDSFWSQFLGKAVDGHYAGTDLEMVPSQLTSWGAWKEQHPETLALDRGFTGPSSDAYISYYNSQGAGILGESNFDVRLPTKSLVVGLDGETSQMAYPAGLMLATEVVNDTLEDTPLVVFANRESSAITVFRRTVDRTTLTFEQRSEPNLVTDMESGSVWDKGTGLAVEGDLKGKQLEPHRFILSFWFAWSDFYPDTKVYGSLDG